MFSQRVDGLRPSPIRSILKVIDRPGMVSFAGGLPAPDVLPAWSGSVPPEVLQYGPSEGETELRTAVSERLRTMGIDAPTERVMILSGSQQGIDLTAKLFVDPGTKVAVEYPTYLAALQVLRLRSRVRRYFLAGGGTSRRGLHRAHVRESHRRVRQRGGEEQPRGQMPANGNCIVRGRSVPRPFI